MALGARVCEAVGGRARGEQRGQAPGKVRACMCGLACARACACSHWACPFCSSQAVAGRVRRTIKPHHAQPRKPRPQRPFLPSPPAGARCGPRAWRAQPPRPRPQAPSRARHGQGGHASGRCPGSAGSSGGGSRGGRGLEGRQGGAGGGGQGGGRAGGCARQAHARGEPAARDVQPGGRRQGARGGRAVGWVRLMRVHACTCMLQCTRSFSLSHVRPPSPPPAPQPGAPDNASTMPVPAPPGRAPSANGGTLAPPPQQQQGGPRPGRRGGGAAAWPKVPNPDLDAWAVVQAFDRWGAAARSACARVGAGAWRPGRARARVGRSGSVRACSPARCSSAPCASHCPWWRWLVGWAQGADGGGPAGEGGAGAVPGGATAAAALGHRHPRHLQVRRGPLPRAAAARTSRQGPLLLPLAARPTAAACLRAGRARASVRPGCLQPARPPSRTLPPCPPCPIRTRAFAQTSLRPHLPPVARAAPRWRRCSRWCATCAGARCSPSATPSRPARRTGSASTRATRGCVRGGARARGCFVW